MKANPFAIAMGLASVALVGGFASSASVPSAASRQLPGFTSDNPLGQFQTAATKEDIREERVPPDPPDGDKDKDKK